MTAFLQKNVMKPQRTWLLPSHFHVGQKIAYIFSRQSKTKNAQNEENKVWKLLSGNHG